MQQCVYGRCTLQNSKNLTAVSEMQSSLNKSQLDAKKQNKIFRAKSHKFILR